MTALPLLAAALLCASSADATDAAVRRAPLRRFALVAGSNDGGASRPLLRYASTDARAFARVLEQLGGTAPDDRILLIDPDRAKLLDGLRALEGAIQRARGTSDRVEAIVYYSGHSDEEGVLLGSQRVTYPELRAAIARLPADVRIAVLDSCASGALIRTKGGKRLPSFLVDESSAVRGHAFLTASSADEAAQESERLGGSYFTYALLSGLRGAADASRDGRVTLSEAYQFAFQETLARTEKSQAGPQHPAWDIQLAGKGDLVITDVRSTSAGLVLGEELRGRIALRDASGVLVAELTKPGGAPIELGLEPGTYRVTLDQDGEIFQGRVAVAEGQRTRLTRDQLARVAAEAVALRGGAAAEPAVASAPAPAPGPSASPPSPSQPAPAWRHVPVDVSLVPPISLNGEDPDHVSNHLSFFALAGRSGRLDGVGLGLGVGMVTESARGAQITVVGNTAGTLQGLQLTTGFNVAREASDAIQIAYALNLVQGRARGVQIAAGANIASGALLGLQIAAGLNLMKEAGPAAQMAAGANLASGGLTGLQLAAGLNHVTGRLDGLQIAGGANVAGELRGLQLGTVDIAESGVGAQVGVVTQGGARGFRLGVVNLSSTPDVETFGLVNLVKDGYFRLSAWGSDLSMANAGLKMGGRHLYTVLGAGVQPDRAPKRWATTGGLGGHFEATDRLFFDLDLTATQFFERGEDQHARLAASLRAMAGLRLATWLELVAGPTFNASVAWNGREPVGSHAPKVAFHSDNDEVTTELFPGFMAGLQVPVL